MESTSPSGSDPATIPAEQTPLGDHQPHTMAENSETGNTAYDPTQDPGYVAIETEDEQERQDEGENEEQRALPETAGEGGEAEVSGEGAESPEEGTQPKETETAEGGAEAEDGEKCSKTVVIVESGVYSRMEFTDVFCEHEEEERVLDFEYNMKHPKRGVAVIFNNGTFSRAVDLPDRVGYKEEGADLKKSFATLGFDVRYYQDLTVQNIVTVLQLVIMEGQEDADSLVVVFMTHGQRQTGTTNDVIFGKDGPLWVHNIVAKFDGESCPTLIGKPKLFFIEASRGDQVDSGVVVPETETDGYRRRKKIPLEADILLAQSTVAGYKSFSTDPKGSAFIRSLTRTLLEHGRTRDIHWLLTRVNSLVAAEFESSSVDRALNRKRQMPIYTSTLTKLLFFPPSTPKEDNFML